MSNKKLILAVLLFLFFYGMVAINYNDSTQLGSTLQHETNTRFLDIEGEYQEGEILIKYHQTTAPVLLGFGSNQDKLMKEELEAAGISSFVKLNAVNRSLKTVTLDVSQPAEIWIKANINKDMNILQVLANLGAISNVVEAEPNYIYYTAEDGEPVVVTDPLMVEQYYLNEIKVNEARAHLESMGINPGGSRDVVVAVIDTGVDYLHEDLAPNMWVNTAEIPGNGIDDDNNGIVDDIYGGNFVSDSRFTNGNPMDDHGHGTHVAGIIAAKGGNGVGIQGVADNVRIMALKASASSGIFLSADIAEAVSYAYEKGADVINMSFGGYAKSNIVEDALAIAFSRAVLVAAAGNDAYINEPHLEGKDMFPAAYPWVVGVMASSNFALTSFSNFDYAPEDAHEYSIVAPGAFIMSTLPNNKYAKWSGTSMATPIVSGVAALLRSKFTDSGHNSRFIMGQLIGTAETPIEIPMFYKLAYRLKWECYFQVDAFLALTNTPKPNLSYYDYTIWDSESIDPINNNDGIFDSGELINLGLFIRNHWGQARDVEVILDTVGPGGVSDPYLEFVNDRVNYGQVGSFSTDDNGLIYNEEERVTGVENPFIIRMSPDTPNDYVVRINITIIAKNALDPLDETTYVKTKDDDSRLTFTITVRNGVELPNLITEDMTLTNDKFYIISNATRIEDNATVTVEAGTKIQFWSSKPEDPYAETPIAYLRVDGTLLLNGTLEEPIEMFPSGLFESFEVRIFKQDAGQIHMNYTKIQNPRLNVSTISNSYFTQNSQYVMTRYISGGTVYSNPSSTEVYAQTIDRSIFWKNGSWNKFYVNGYVTNSLFDSNNMNIEFSGENNVFLNNFQRDMGYYDDQLYVSSGYAYYTDPTATMNIQKVFRNEITGKTYVQISQVDRYEIAQRFARYLGGHLAVINDANENDYIRKNITGEVGIGLRMENLVTGHVWINGDAFNYTNWREDINTKDISKPFVMLDSTGSWRNTNNLNHWLIELSGDIYINDIVLTKDYITLGHDSLPYPIEYELVPYTANVNDLQWYSMNEAIATVSSAGIVTPVAPGSTTIVVKSLDGVVTKSLTLNVVQTVPLESIDLIGKAQLNVGDVYKIPYTLTPFNTTELTFTWSSSNPELATVDNQGRVTAHHTGSVTITATKPNSTITDSYTFNIVQPVTSLSFVESYLISYVGADSLPVEILINPDTATNKTIIFESANPDVAYIDSQGLLHAVSNGMTVIRAIAEHTTIFAETTVSITTEEVANTKFIDLQALGWHEYLRYFALTETGDVWYWGRNGADLPTKMTNISNVKQMSMGYSDGLMLTKTGEVYLIQDNGEQNLVTRIPLDFTDIKAVSRTSYNGNNVNLFLRNDGTVWASGSNTFGQLPGIILEELSSVEQLNVSDVVDILAFDHTSVFLKNDGTVHYAGFPNSENITTKVDGLQNITQIKYSRSSDNSNPLVIAKDVNNNFYRVLFYDSFAQVGKIFFNELTDTVVDYVEVNGYHQLVLTDQGKVYSFGANWNGQLGLGHTQSIYHKYSLVNIAPVSQIFGSYYNSATISSSGKIQMWGSNNYYNLGDHTTKNRTSPVSPLIGFSKDNVQPIILNADIFTDKFNINDSIEIIYGEAIKASTNYMSIKLVDSNNQPVSIARKLVLNKLIIDPVSSLRYGEIYTLIIPNNAVVDYFGNSNSGNYYAVETQGGIKLNQSTYRIDLSDLPITIGYTTNPEWSEPLVFSSNDETIATVDAAGVITPVGLGQTTIIIKNLSQTYQWSVKVEVIHRIELTAVTIEQNALTINKNQTQLLTINQLPANANEVLIWSSSDPTVASVDEYGFVKGLKNGSATITVKSDFSQNFDSITITVIEPVTDVSIFKNIDVVNFADGTYQMTASVAPSTATNQTLIYESANPEIATVDSNGLVTLHQAGSVVLRARAENTSIYDDLYLSISDQLDDMGQIMDVQMLINHDNPKFYALTDRGDVWMWGHSTSVPVKMNGLSNVIAMSSSYDHIYFRTSNGLIYVAYYWDNNIQSVNNEMTGIAQMSHMDYNISYELILKSDGTVWGKGNNQYGHLAGITTGQIDTFTQLPNLSNIKKVIATRNAAFFLNQNGTLSYAGGNYSVINQTQIYNIPLISDIEYHDYFYPDYSYITAKDVNGNYINIYIWQDASGNSVVDIITPDFSSLGEKVVDYQSNMYSEFAVTESGKIYVKGQNDYGQLGLGHTQHVQQFTLLDNKIYQYAFLTGANGYAIDQHGDLYGWGFNHRGQLGIYEQSNYIKPSKTMFGFRFDDTNPVVLSQLPQANEVNVNINQTIEIVFNEKISQHYNYANIRLLDQSGSPVSIERKMTINSIIIDPVAPLQYGMRYTVNIPSNALIDHFSHPNALIYYTFDTEAGVQFERTQYKLDINDNPTQLIYSPNIKWTDPLSFTSSDVSIVTIDSNGIMTPVSVGLADITISNPTSSYVWTIHVQVLHRIPLTVLDVTEDALVINKNQTKRILFNAEPSTYNEDIIWTSSDPLVALVDEFGFVKGLKNGTVTITAESASGLLQDSLTITVIEPVEQISTPEEFMVVNLNDSPIQIPVTITPETATDKTIIWESSSPEIAYVDLEGYLQSVSKGTATIRGTVRNSHLYVEVVVTVSDEISYTTKFIDVGVLGYEENMRIFALTDDGNVWYWGRDNAFLPQRITNLVNVKEMSISTDRGIFLTHDGNVYELYSNGITNQYYIINTGIDGIKHISHNSYGNEHTLLLRDDQTIWARGYNSYGEFGSIDYQHTPNFVQIDGVTNAVDVISSQISTVILASDGYLYYLGGSSKKVVPTKIEGLSNIVSMKRSGMTWNGHNYLIVKNAEGSFFKVYLHSDEPTVSPISLGGFTNVLDYATNYDGSEYIVTEDGKLYAKGSNNYGQLGLGHTNQANTYSEVTMNNVESVFAFGQNAALLTQEGELYIWGRNSSKQIGDLSSDNRLTPFKALIGLTVDENAPTVTTHSPYQNEINVDVNNEIVIDFDEGIRRSSNYVNIQLLDKNNKLVSIEKTIKLDKLYIKPISPLRFGENYRVVIPENSFVDYFMNQSSYKEFNFKTEEGVKFSKTTYRIDIIEDPASLLYTINPVWNQPLIFTSLNPSVVTVSAIGVMTPVSLGTTQIRITSEDGLYQWLVNVEVIERINLTSLSITKDDLTISKGYSERIEFTASPSNYNEDILWTSSDPSVASVDEFGFVKGLKNGSTVITGSSLSGLYSDSIQVTVIEPVTSLSFAQPEIILYKLADPYQLVVNINPVTATNQNIIWTSANPDIVEVSSTGLITPKAVGTTVVRACAEFTNIIADLLVTISDININDINFVDVDTVGSADYLRVFALTSTGNVWYWGREGGQIPRQLTQLSNIKQMSVSYNYAYFLTNDGAVYRVQPNGESNNIELQETGITNIASISAQNYSSFHTLLVRTDGSVWGKGDNTYGQIAGIPNSNVEVFVQLEGLSNIKTALALHLSSVYLTTSGQVYYSGTENQITQATLIPGLSNIESIKVSQNYHSSQNTFIAKSTTGTYYRVQFAGNTISTTTIDLSSMAETVIDYAENQDEHRLVLTQSGKVYAKGSNYYGQLGDGTRINSHYNFVDTKLTNVVKVVASRLNSFALTADGDIYMWGYNNYNHMGTSSLPQFVTSPFKILIGSTLKNDAPIISSITGDGTSRIPVDGMITVDYNQAVKVGYNFSNIRLYDPFGNSISIEKKHDFDKIYITPMEPLRYGSIYSVVIPSGSVTSYYGYGSSSVTKYVTTEQGVIFERMNYKIDLGDEPMTIAYTLHEDWTQNLLFSSNNTLVATVNQFGEIAPRGVGTATIKVYTSDLAYSFDINVEVLHKISISHLTLTEESFVINKDETKRIIPLVEPTNYNEDIIFTSSHPLVASVDEFGYVKGLMNGTAIITVKSASGLYSDTITVTVIEPVTSIRYEQNIVMMTTADDPLLINVEVLPITATNKNIIWRSTNVNIAYFDNGLLVPVSAGVVLVRAQAEHSLIYKDILVSITEAAVEKPVIIDVAIANYYENYTSVFALDNQGYIWSWGEGALGTIESDDSKPTPTKLNITDVVAIESSKSTDHIAKVIALKSDGTVWGIGRSEYPVGNGQYSSYTFTKANYLTNITQISTSYYHTAVLKNDGTVWTWGNNHEYHLGDGTKIQRTSPFQVAGLSNIAQVATTHSATYALSHDGRLYVHGHNRFQTPTQVQLPSNFTIKKLVGNGNQTTITMMTTQNKIYEYDYYNNNFNEINMAVPAGRTIVDYDMYGNGYFFLLDNGEAIAYGGNGYGQLGNGVDFADHWQGNPTKVALAGIKSIGGSYFNGYAITNDGSLYLWGRNHTNQLANFTNITTNTPQLIHFGTLSDDNKPILQQTSVTNNQTEVPVTSSFTLTYSEALRQSDNFSQIKLLNSQNELISLNMTLNWNILEITPLVSLDQNETYQLIIPDSALSDMFGNTSTGSVINFTTVNPAEPLSDVTVPARHYWTINEVNEYFASFILEGYNSKFFNNAILNNLYDLNVQHWLRFMTYESDNEFIMSGNYWGTADEILVGKQIIDFNDYQSYAKIKVTPFLTQGNEMMYPFVTDVIVSTASEADVMMVGAEMITITVKFNRDMDLLTPLRVFFGPDYPFTDYQVPGEWVDPRTWSGQVQITQVTGDGKQYFRIRDAVAADNPWLWMGDDDARFMFEINSFGAEAMNLQATGGEGAVELTWMQDEFETLAGYNMYRSDTLNGSFYKLNDSLIPGTSKSYSDFNVEPGKAYFYKFTIVKTDLSESDYSNVAFASAYDIIPPQIFHTPLAKSSVGQEIQITAQGWDNLHITSFKLYYRLQGDTVYKETEMVEGTNNRFTGKIPASDAQVPGIEYYLDISDGRTVVSSGSQALPHLIKIQDNPTITNIAPNTGIHRGGTEVVISGLNFKVGAKVYFSTLEGLYTVVENENTIRVQTPAYQPYKVNVRVVNPDGSEHVIYNGFTYIMDDARVVIGSATVSKGSDVQIPVRIEGAQNLLALDLEIGYDSTALTYVSATKTTMSGRFVMQTNATQSSKVLISMASDMHISGSGDLLILNFKTNTQAIGSTTQVSVNHVTANSINEGIGAVSGIITFATVYQFAGSVVYYGNGAAVTNVKVQLISDNTAYSSTTPLDGTYSFNGVVSDDYQLAASKGDQFTAITAYDASEVLRYAVQLIDLNANQRIAADVNEDGLINSMDAAMILQYVAGLRVLPFEGASSMWKFVYPQSTYSGLNRSYLNQSITAILLGDVSGNYVNNNGQSFEHFGVISIGTMIEKEAGFDVPVYLEFYDYDLYSFETTIHLEDGVTIEDVIVSAELQSAFYVVNPTTNGDVRIAVASATPLDLTNPVITIRVHQASPTLEKIQVTFSQTLFNEYPDIVEVQNVYRFNRNFDFNHNGTIDQQDILTFIQHYNKTYGYEDISFFDVNRDGTIDIYDVIMANHLN